MSNVEIIAGVATLIVSVAGLFLAVRAEIRSQHESIIKDKLDAGKRHICHEHKLRSFERRIANIEECIHNIATNDRGFFLNNYQSNNENNQDEYQ
jgi:hypothetical protein